VCSCDNDPAIAGWDGYRVFMLGASFGTTSDGGTTTTPEAWI